MGHSLSSGTHSASGTHSVSRARSGSASAQHSYARRPSYSSRAYSRAPLASHSSGRVSRGHSGLGVRIRSYGYGGYGYGSNCYGCGYGFGYGYPYLGGGVDPYWWGDFSSLDQPYQSGPVYQVNPEDQDDQEQGDEDAYAHSAPPSSPPQHQAERTVAAPATVLVFRDQHKQEVQNYAIVGETLWNFAPHRTEKIPLSDLDIPATTKANDERGVTFRLPAVSEDQQLHINIQLRDSVDN
jgi:hypothetical protein